MNRAVVVFCRCERWWYFLIDFYECANPHQREKDVGSVLPKLLYLKIIPTPFISALFICEPQTSYRLRWIVLWNEDELLLIVCFP